MTNRSRKEQDFQKVVVGYLRGRGDCWWIETKPPAQPIGTPDIICCCKGHFVAMELKREISKGYGTTHAQDGSIRVINTLGGIAFAPRSLKEIDEALNNLQQL